MPSNAHAKRRNLLRPQLERLVIFLLIINFLNILKYQARTQQKHCYTSYIK
jgi:hypothetical protein